MSGYVVHFKEKIDVGGYGFYAKSQPNHNWSFTKDLEKAHIWQTKSAAIARKEWGEELYDNVTGTVFPVRTTIIKEH